MKISELKKYLDMLPDDTEVVIGVADDNLVHYFSSIGDISINQDGQLVIEMPEFDPADLKGLASLTPS